jgi:formate dehydrogenase subunit gamma
MTVITAMGKRLLAAALFASMWSSAAAQQASTPEVKPALPPAGFVAPAEPKPDDTNAQRNTSQPGNNAPMWRDVKNAQGTTTLPGVEKGMLIQPVVDYLGVAPTNAGEAWRHVRNQIIIPYGGALMAMVLAAIALFYWRKGSLGSHAHDTGRLVERFTPFERVAHWSNAIAFSVLAVSGLVMTFGKYLLLPIIGSALFGWLTYALKTAHNFAGPVFAVSLVVVIATFVRDNFPSKDDWTWVKKGGGLFSGAEVPSHRFNAGEKLLFWGGVFAFGLVVVGSGLVLNKLVPGLLYTRGEMQIAHMVHSAAALVMMTMFLGHIYMGTLGMKGAFSAMRTGYVDEAWAHEHHQLWADDIRTGKVPAQRSAIGATPAATPTNA